MVLDVEHVEADLEHLDLVILQRGDLVDGPKVDALERLLLLRRHLAINEK